MACMPKEANGILCGQATEQPLGDTMLVAGHGTKLIQLLGSQDDFGGYGPHSGLLLIWRDIQADARGNCGSRPGNVPFLADKILVLRAMKIDVRKRNVKTPERQPVHPRPEFSILIDQIDGMDEIPIAAREHRPAGRETCADLWSRPEQLKLFQFNGQQNASGLIRKLKVPPRDGMHRYVQQHRVHQKVWIRVGSKKSVAWQDDNATFDAFITASAARLRPLKQRPVKQVLIHDV